MTEPLWTPSSTRIAKSNATAFTKALELQWGVKLPDYEALHAFSVEEMEKFWLTFWDFAEIKAETRGERVLVDADKMPGAQFFPDARLNFAENLLTRRGDNEALVFWAEDKVKRRMTWRELYDGVSRLSQAMRAMGIEKGDRIAGFVPNMPETIMAMLATASIGAIWTSCSPDFGIKGVLDRFGQTEPKILFTADGYYYNGKSHDSLNRVKEIVAELPSVNKVIVLRWWMMIQSPRRFSARKRWPISSRISRRATLNLNSCRSIIRSISCIPAAPPAHRNASFTGLAAPC